MMLNPEKPGNKAILNDLGVKALAYLGDAVFELIVREHLVVSTGVSDPGKLNKLAASYVKATEQSRAVSRIEEFLTEEESAVYRRGRNINGVSVPHSASAVEYRRSTGLETLFAYLYLSGKNERIRELFYRAFPDGTFEDKA